MPCSCRHSLLLLLLGVSSSFASLEEQVLPGQSSLYAQLSRFEDRSYPEHRSFPEVLVDCEFYTAAVVEHVLPGPQHGASVYLVSIPTDFAGYHLFPNIVSRKPDGRWVRASVPHTFAGWSHVHRSASGDQILLMMDNVPETPGGNPRFVHSSDRGMTWKYISELRLSAYFQAIRYFHLDDAGVGVAVEYRDGETDGYEEAGYFVYRTWDWARSWSGPEYFDRFDVSGLTDVTQAARERRRGRSALRRFELDGLARCAQE